MRTLSIPVLAGLMLLGPGCEERNKIVAGRGVDECNVTNMTLSGTQWVMWEAMPDGTSRANPRARMKFYEEDEMLKVDYTVGSPYEVHTYECRLAADEVKCAEEPRLFDWCLSLEVHKAGSCTPARLQEIAGPGMELEPAEIAEAQQKVKEELELVAKRAEENPRFLAQYKLSKNTLANKLQGILDVRVRERKCQLMVTDQYMTIYNGQKVVDSNPVGTNPFVQDKDNTWLYENCVEGTRFLAMSQETPPTDEELKALDPKRQFGASDTVHYHYVGVQNIKPEEGCTYSADLWAQWKPKAKDVAMEVVDCEMMVPSEDDPEKGEKLTKCVQWSSDHVWKDDMERLEFVSDMGTAPRAFYGMTRYKTCGGEKEKLDTICASTRVMKL
jgi:hypothetical protein